MEPKREPPAANGPGRRLRGLATGARGRPVRRRRPPPAPLPPLLEAWRRALVARRLAAHTIRAYLNDVQQFGAWLGRPLEEATSADLARFSEYMAGPAGLHARSQLRRLVALRRFYAHLAQLGHVPANPAVDVALPKTPRTRITRFWTPVQVRRLLDAIPDTPEGRRDRAAIELGLSSLRVSEVAGLRIGDLFLDRSQVEILGKGGGTYLQAITPDAVQALRSWLAVRPEAESPFVFLRLLDRGGRVAAYPGRGGLTTRSLERILRHYLTRAGVPRPQAKTMFHGLRHTLGVTLADRGVPLEYIQDLFRHQDPRTTRLYTDVSAERLREVLRNEAPFTRAPKGGARSRA